MAKPSPTIFTVGHGTRPVGDFLAILESARVRRLVDVRTAPGSRRNPQYGGDALAASLEARGIEYAWRKDLGGFRKPRPDSPHLALESGGLRGYADHMDTEEFRADALSAAGCGVVHLMDGGRREPHRLHAKARVEGTRLIYDVGAQQTLTP